RARVRFVTWRARAHRLVTGGNPRDGLRCRARGYRVSRREVRNPTMSKTEALFQSLASCGAAIIAFIGVCHEVVGDIVFPWGPALLGGAVGWHGLGLFAIAVGLMLLGGTLRLIRFPVVPFALLIIAMGIAIGAFAAIAH